MMSSELNRDAKFVSLANKVRMAKKTKQGLSAARAELTKYLKSKNLTTGAADVSKDHELADLFTDESTLGENMDTQNLDSVAASVAQNPAIMNQQPPADGVEIHNAANSIAAGEDPNVAAHRLTGGVEVGTPVIVQHWQAFPGVKGVVKAVQNAGYLQVTMPKFGDVSIPAIFVKPIGKS